MKHKRTKAQAKALVDNIITLRKDRLSQRIIGNKVGISQSIVSGVVTKINTIGREATIEDLTYNESEYQPKKMRQKRKDQLIAAKFRFLSSRWINA